ncbi:GntR family transcriptional regulator [Streptomyces sp. NPDC046716]|uniref:GntR family transcriptional regulator n=1 Tax=Streptomyces sp. NPDC046716 TaxID=3157093 RepID=UPI0033FA5D4B
MPTVPTSRPTGPRTSAIGDTHLSLRDRVYVELRERIIEGRYPAGLRLVERELAEELGVSRVPVREAMQRLEAERFLTVQARRGAVVTGFGPDDAEHLFDVRENLEELAAGLAARRRDAAGLRTLAQLLKRTRRASGAGRLRDVVNLNADFHQAVAEASGNPVLIDLMAPLDSRLRRLFHLTSAPDDAGPMCGEHERLYEAIGAGDEEAARALARAHVAGTRAAALALLAAHARANTQDAAFQ